jgi:hypothetical protein
MKNSLIIDIRQVGHERQVFDLSNGSIFITMGEWRYYIDNSTGEEIIKKWKSDWKTDNTEYEPIWVRQTEFHQNQN